MNATLSRFAVLRIEDDEEEKAAQRARDRQKAAAFKVTDKKRSDEKSKQSAEKVAAKKVKASKERAELQALAFGGPKKHKKPSQNCGKVTKKSQSSIKQEAPSEWIQRDENFVEDVYEQQLREALLVSKLDYEEKKIAYTTHEKELKEEQKMAKKKQQGKKGAVTLSLDEFNLQLSQQSSTAKGQVPSGEQTNGYTEDAHFFEKITEEAKKISSYEKIKNDIFSQKKNKPQKALAMSDIPRLAQLEEDLNKASEEIAALHQENEKLQEELLGVKTRNKRLCSILAQGEMREKAELLIEMEKLSTIKDELTTEVENLSRQLQQERSKASALSTDTKKSSAQKKRQDSIGK